MKKVGFVSLGCPKNLVDSEVMMGQLKQAGYEITNNSDEADTVVVNTCGFIESAKAESIEAILEATSAKANGKAQRVVVAGCLVERYRDDLIKELPEVDAFIGTNELGRILEAADEKVNFRELPLLEIGNKSATYLYDFDTPRYRATDSYTAFIIAFRRGIGRDGRAVNIDSCARRNQRFGMDSRNVCLSDAYFRRFSRSNS